MLLEFTLDTALQYAVTAQREGHLKDAEKIYDIILDKDPLNCDANHNRGVLEIQAGNHEGSICFLERALQTDPNNVQYWVSYTDTLVKLGTITDLKTLEHMLTKLSPSQFSRLITSFAQNGTKFHDSLILIQRYFSILENTDAKLQLENYLANNFLKRYENEKNYNEFYTMISSFYGIKKKKRSTQKNKNSIVFFVHNPVFLAHTNPMFKMLESRSNFDFEVIIVSLGFNIEFQNRCNELSVKYIGLPKDSLTDAYKELYEISKDKLALVWMCFPAHLNYVSQKLSNIVWWSLKFHPNIPEVMLRVRWNYEGYPVSRIHNQDWHNLFVGFDIANFSSQPNSWKKRQNNFGSFCREELIDDEFHWQNVKSILDNNPNFVYHYTGKKTIHQKWFSIVKFDETRVKYVGWLSKPQDKIKDMMFLLDGPNLGHGLMCFEAIDANVPIVTNASTSGAYPNFLARIEQLSEPNTKLSNVYDTVFSNTKELKNICIELACQDKNNSIAKTLRAARKRENTTSHNFPYFIELIKTFV